MPLADLKKTPYYNEFLRAYGLYHGINIYFVRNVVWILVIYAFGVRKTPTRLVNVKKNIKTCLNLILLKPYPLDLSTQYGLTSREQEVGSLVSKGLSDKDVANLLDISFTTLRTHLNNSMRKIGCNNLTEMAFAHSTLSLSNPQF